MPKQIESGEYNKKYTNEDFEIVAKIKKLNRRGVN